MIAALLSFDKTATLLFAGLFPRNPFFNVVFSFLSFQGFTIVAWILIITLLVIFEERKNRRFLFYFFASLILAFFLTYFIKVLVHRARPAGIMESLLNICPRDFSFPSGHTATAFAAAFMLAFFDKKRKYIYFLFASLIAYSRIYLQCHFVLDVAGGIILAYGISLILIRIYHRNIKIKKHKK